MNKLSNLAHYRDFRVVELYQNWKNSILGTTFGAARTKKQNTWHGKKYFHYDRVLELQSRQTMKNSCAV